MNQKADFAIKFEEISLIRESGRGRIVLASYNGKKEPVIVKIIKEANIDIYKKIQEMNSYYFPEIYEVAEAENCLCIVEEYVIGETLHEYLLNNNLTKTEFIDIATQVADALSEIHSCDPPIIHRDIKPDNILITKEKKIKIIDFDAARNYDKDRNVAETVCLGTVEYAAPEQYGYSQTDERSDIYSFGVVLNEMFAKCCKLSSKSEAYLKKIINKATSFDPNSRYASVISLKKDIEKARNVECRSLLYVLGVLAAAAVLVVAIVFWGPKVKNEDNLASSEVRNETVGEINDETGDVKDSIDNEKNDVTAVESEEQKESEVKVETEVQSEAEVKAETEVQSEAEVKTGTDVQSETEVQPETEMQPETEVQTEVSYFRSLGNNTRMLKYEMYFTDHPAPEGYTIKKPGVEESKLQVHERILQRDVVLNFYKSEPQDLLLSFYGYDFDPPTDVYFWKYCDDEQFILLDNAYSFDNVLSLKQEMFNSLDAGYYLFAVDSHYNFPHAIWVRVLDENEKRDYPHEVPHVFGSWSEYDLEKSPYVTITIADGGKDTFKQFDHSFLSDDLFVISDDRRTVTFDMRKVEEQISFNETMRNDGITGYMFYFTTLYGHDVKIYLIKEN
ncbi:MAG: protein kinase [Lachnospiraceae bacterium]|nr:protein kinase [Lachnospiraceae bacterium]